MSGIGAHTYPTVAQIDAPDKPFYMVSDYAAPVSVRGTTYRSKYATPGVPVHGTWVEGEDMWVFADGYSPMRVYKDRTFARVGILPPYPNPIVGTPTGGRATAKINFIGQPANGDYIWIGDAGAGPRRVTFMTALVNPGDPGYPGDQVLRGVNLAASINNLEALVNNTAGQDSIYHNQRLGYGFGTYTFEDVGGIEATLNTGTSLTFRAVNYGTSGNAYIATMGVNTTGMTWQGGTGTGPYPSNIGYFTGGTAGTGTAPLGGKYHYTHRYFRSLDGALSGCGDRIVVDVGEPMNVGLTFGESDDPVVSQVQWMRSLYQTGLFFYGGSADAGVGSATDDKLDEEIAVADPYNDLEFRPYQSGHVPSFRCVEQHLGCLFAGGAHLLRDVAVSLDVTAGSYSATVTAGTKPWQSSMEGGSIVFDDYPDLDIICVDYNSSGPTVRFNKPWPKSTATETAVWKDARDPNYLAWSMPLKSNQFPPANGLEGVVDDTGHGITALKAFWSRLNVFTPESIFALSGTLGGFQLRRVSDGIGSTSHQGIVAADGLLFFPGQGAFFMWDGNETPVNLSFPPGETRGMKDTMARINWRAADVISGHFDPYERLIRWAVPMDDAWYPTHVLTYDVQRHSWGIDSGLFVDRFISVSDGARAHAVGVGHSRFFFTDLAGVDNYHSGTHVTTITSIEADTGRITLYDASTTLEACGAIVVTADGTYYAVTLTGGDSGSYEVQRGYEQIPNFTAGDQVILGGILMWLRTGEMSFGYMARTGRITDLDLGFRPQGSAGRVYVAVGADDTDPSLPEFGEAYGDLTESDGHYRARLNVAARRHTIDVISAMPGDNPELVEMGVGYRTPNKRKYQV